MNNKKEMTERKKNLLTLCALFLLALLPACRCCRNTCEEEPCDTYENVEVEQVEGEKADVSSIYKH